VGRRVSKSTGWVNNPGEPGIAFGSCAVTRLSADDFTVQKTIELRRCGGEIYDLLPVEVVNG
jgi:hypothetical protein